MALNLPIDLNTVQLQPQQNTALNALNAIAQVGAPQQQYLGLTPEQVQQQSQQVNASIQARTGVGLTLAQQQAQFQRDQFNQAQAINQQYIQGKQLELQAERQRIDAALARDQMKTSALQRERIAKDITFLEYREAAIQNLDQLGIDVPLEDGSMYRVTAGQALASGNTAFLGRITQQAIERNNALQIFAGVQDEQDKLKLVLGGTQLLRTFNDTLKNAVGNDVKLIQIAAEEDRYTKLLASLGNKNKTQQEQYQEKLNQLRIDAATQRNALARQIAQQVFAPLGLNNSTLDLLVGNPEQLTVSAEQSVQQQQITQDQVNDLTRRIYESVKSQLSPNPAGI